jgi:O-antigen ligase
MTILVPITLFGWVPCVLLLFMWLPPRRAVVTAFMAGWLFLPAATFDLPGLPDYSKMAATCAGILLAALVFDIDTLLSIRPRWFDLPMIVWCFMPFVTNSVEGIDSYDSLSWSVNRMITWGMPYFVGRVYFTDADAIRQLAVGFVIGALIYIPICWFEIRMSPQISAFLYGVEGGYSGTRLGGWRPQGLMASGLMLGMWMTSASLLAVWMWATGALKHIGKRKAGWLIVALVVTTVFCKSTGALMLMMTGLACLFAIRKLGRATPVLLLCLPAAVYPAIRAGSAWDGLVMVQMAEGTVGRERAQSLEFRLQNEDILSTKALQRFWWGWGRFGRSRVLNEYGKDISTTDGEWIIALGESGVIGLAAVTMLYLLPVIRLWWRLKGPLWADPSFAAVSAFAVILTLYSIDNILNAMINPVITVVIGGLNGALLRYIATESAPMEAFEETLPLRKTGPRRSLWPPQPANTVAGPPEHARAAH